MDLKYNRLTSSRSRHETLLPGRPPFALAPPFFDTRTGLASGGAPPINLNLPPPPPAPAPAPPPSPPASPLIWRTPERENMSPGARGGWTPSAAWPGKSTTLGAPSQVRFSRFITTAVLASSSSASKWCQSFGFLGLALSGERGWAVLGLGGWWLLGVGCWCRLLTENND